MSRSKAKVKKATKRSRVLPGARPDAEALLAWYDRNRRIMPWRALPGAAVDPYRVWVSEIMLQQTTVAAVAPYFQKFLKRWPSPEKLARASLNDVRHMWAGLGYYRRAQNLHAAARQIQKQFGGALPDSEAELLKLPGFGTYTAAAVAAIAFDRRANVIDGNVERVMARIFAIETPLPKAKTEIRGKAEALLPNARFGDYAQALMDLGATICTPRNPKCLLCPWASACKAFKTGTQETYPRRAAKTERPVRRGVAFLLGNQEGEIFLRRRPAKGLLAGMLEIPSTLWSRRPNMTLAEASKAAPLAADWRFLPGTVRHVFTHFELELTVAVGSTKTKTKIAPKGHWIARNRLGAAGLPSVMRKIVQHAYPLIE